MTPSVASPLVAPAAPALPATETAVAAPAPEAELRRYDSEAAFNRAIPRIKAVSEETLLPFNRDVVTIVNVVLRAVPMLLTHLPALHETYVSFDDVRLTGLTDAANALHHAHHTLESSLKGSDELAQIFPRCTTLRDNMIYDINGLVRRVIVKKGLLTDLRGPYGYAEVASDLSRMVAIYREVGEAATGYRSVPQAEVDEAHALADKLRFLLAHREKAEAGQAERARVRHQAYTLVLRDYDYVRRLLDTVFFIRGKGDIDAIAPSAHATRGSRGSKKAGEEKVEPTNDEPTDGKVAGPTGGSTPAPAPEPQDETTGFVLAGTNIPAGLRAPFGGLPRPHPPADDAPLCCRRFAMPSPTLHLGASSALEAGGSLSSFLLPAHHLVTHGVVVGMTGSGKTGALTVLCEEALRSGVPCHSSSGIDFVPCGNPLAPPALLTRMSRPPSASSAVSAIVFIPEAEATSPPTNAAPAGRAAPRERADTTTLAPASGRRCAMAAPMPRVPPVTSARRPMSCPMGGPRIRRR